MRARKRNPQRERAYLASETLISDVAENGYNLVGLRFKINTDAFGRCRCA